MVGTVDDYKTEAEAQNAVDALRLTINEQTPRQQLREISFETLVEHYRQHEMPDIYYKGKQLPGEFAEDENRKSYATQETYQGYLKKWILPRWKSYRLPDIKPVQVEQWLKSLALAPGSKAKIRNIMSALFSHALRWEWTNKNPISSVRQSAKRRNIPVVLTIEQIQCFLSHLKDPCRTAVLLDFSSGLRVGELLGLKWEDVHFETLEVNITRSVVKQKITRYKTEASRKPIPLDPELAEVLLTWRLKCPYPLGWRLGIRQSAQKGQTAVLAGLALPDAPQAGLGGGGHSGKRGLAHAAAHLRHFDEGQWRGSQDDSGALASFQLQGDGRHLYAGGDTHQTGGADQTGEDDFAGKESGRRRKAEGPRFLIRTLSEPSAKTVDPVNLFILLASPAGFEPALSP